MNHGDIEQLDERVWCSWVLFGLFALGAATVVL